MTNPTDVTKEEKPEEKSLHEVIEESGDERLKWLPSGIVSFAEFDAMEEAKRAAIQVKNEASLFKAMVDNILELEPSEEMDKSQMILDLAGELVQRIQIEKEVTHFKEIGSDELKAIDEDFEGGCVHCGFSTVDELKELSNCPYCQGTINA